MTPKEKERQLRWLEQIGRLESENKRLRADLEQTQGALAALRYKVAAFAEAVGGAVAHAQAPRGGQHVPFHGDFCRAPPSTLSRLQWWARELLG
jgi:hypothetical protein